MVKSFMLAGLLTLCLSVQAQVSVKGKLVDDKSKLPIGFATVGLLASRDSTVVKEQMVDSTGDFELTGVASGKYLLLFSSLGYRPLYKEILVENHGQHALSLGNISLTTDPRLLTGVVVSGSKPAFQRVAGTLVVNVSENKLFKTAANT